LGVWTRVGSGMGPPAFPHFLAEYYSLLSVSLF
jgi:hypothetical protein